MSRKKKNVCCEYCGNCIPIGEGDHVCNECGEPVIVISDYEPAEDYLKCGGKYFET